MFEYIFAGVLYSAFTCWYLFWPGALLLAFGIRWLSEGWRARAKAANPHRWRPRRPSPAPAAFEAETVAAGRFVVVRRASLALLAVAPLLIFARVVAWEWFDFDGFESWPRWFTTHLLVVAPWIQVGAAALVVAARRGTRGATACFAAGTVLLLVAYTGDLLGDPGTLDELGFARM